MTVLTETEWRPREEAHAERMRRWTVPHTQRRARQEKHPVLDFLFTYYSHKPSHLERWSPGLGVVLEGPDARRFLDRKGYHEVPGGIAVDPSAASQRTVTYIGALLKATASRAPRLSCFGLHEWAMVYRQPASELRHAQLPLRLGSPGTDEVVESMGVRCGHFDAFRFFTPEARPRNELQPTRETQADFEQPGCLHANMDLYKWAAKLDPFVPSELLGDCFELAAEIRELDMRASPYDLADHGYPPVRIETADGRREYAHSQAEFARRAAPLREGISETCAKLTILF
ncbi:3-methyladenine DNA glycosylase [Amycolatopsis sp. NPDC059657]|uniref:3-methyladenine DNA glycosylase n=1 Tax=Amycolatopsis sp. NPDC059657 TaxID=3346899 RepID=UPI00366FA814